MAGRVVDTLMKLGLPRFSSETFFSTSSKTSSDVKPTESETESVCDGQAGVAEGGILALPWTWYNAFRWCPTSEAHVAQAERRIMSKVERKFIGKQIDFVSPYDDCPHHMWTLCFESGQAGKSNASSAGAAAAVPLVLVHGFGNGAAFWCMNFEAIAESRDVYAVDMPGFARSSRPKFCTDAKKIEDFFVDSLEEWRRQMKLEKIILLGHSMGGFVVSRYAASYPERVQHLILVDPWGLSKVGEGIDWTKPIPLWIRSTYLTKVNPLKIIRLLGPLGPMMCKVGAYYAWHRYAPFLKEESGAMADYLFHGNVLESSGEDAFQALTNDLFWAKHPALDELLTLDASIGISFMYGGQSWLDASPAEIARSHRPASFVGVDVVDKSGHDIFADQPEEFNRIVNRICNSVDNGFGN